MNGLNINNTYRIYWIKKAHITVGPFYRNQQRCIT